MRSTLAVDPRAESPGEMTMPNLGTLDEPRTIVADAVELQGILGVPDRATGLVLFAHGRGSSCKSTRNQFVARAFRRRGLGTLLFDLLTVEEERRDSADAHLRFDIGLLAARLAAATAWIRREGFDLPLGYFGASTGAAAALIAAAELPREIDAVISRGGRPDLAGDLLDRVQAPTLFVVGAHDTTVLELNRQTLARIHAPKQLAIVPGASHLFEEPGALEEVSRLAGDWLIGHLAPTHALHRASR
jgi:putative phosphoribosyl transferase